MKNELTERILGGTSTMPFYLLLNKVAEAHRTRTSEPFLELIENGKNDNWSAEAINKLIEQYEQDIEETYLTAYSDGLQMAADLVADTRL